MHLWAHGPRSAQDESTSKRKMHPWPQKVVFSWGKMRKRAPTQNPIMGGFWSLGIQFYIHFCARKSKKNFFLMHALHPCATTTETFSYVGWMDGWDGYHRSSKSTLIIGDIAHLESCPLWEDCSQTRLGLWTPLLWRPRQTSNFVFKDQSCFQSLSASLNNTLENH